MFAVFKTGGKQYRAKVGDVVRVETIVADVDSAIELTDVMMVGEGDAVKVGAPMLAGAKVGAKVTAHGRADKILIVKFRRRKHHRKQMGHRQNFTEIEITSISA
jgi:large subunit ribosomal protein L21